MGNGGAMRVAPLGAYFADDLDLLVREASASAAVTHAHPDGQAGAVAVAAAAAYAHLKKNDPSAVSPTSLLAFAGDYCPAGPTRDGLLRADALPADTTTAAAVRELGNGSRVIASDTVPFSLWCAQRHLDDFVEALWTAVSGLGDRDTTCAIVGGVVSLYAPPPAAWADAREPLRFESPVPGHKGIVGAAADSIQSWIWRARGAGTRKR